MAHNPAVLANASVHGTVSRDSFEDFLALRGGGQLVAAVLPVQLHVQPHKRVLPQHPRASRVRAAEQRPQLLRALCTMPH